MKLKKSFVDYKTLPDFPGAGGCDVYSGFGLCFVNKLMQFNHSFVFLLQTPC